MLISQVKADEDKNSRELLYPIHHTICSYSQEAVSALKACLSQQMFEFAEIM